MGENSPQDRFDWAVVVNKYMGYPDFSHKYKGQNLNNPAPSSLGAKIKAGFWGLSAVLALAGVIATLWTHGAFANATAILWTIWAIGGFFLLPFNSGVAALMFMEKLNIDSETWDQMRKKVLAFQIIWNLLIIGTINIIAYSGAAAETRELHKVNYTVTRADREGAGYRSNQVTFKRADGTAIDDFDEDATPFQEAFLRGWTTKTQLTPEDFKALGVPSSEQSSSSSYSYKRYLDDLSAQEMVDFVKGFNERHSPTTGLIWGYLVGTVGLAITAPFIIMFIEGFLLLLAIYPKDFLIMLSPILIPLVGRLFSGLFSRRR